MPWTSKLQSSTTLSTAEAEIMALRDGVKELHATAPLVETLFEGRVEMIVESDSQACIGAVKNGKSSAMRHVKKSFDCSLMFLRDQVAKILKYIPSAANISDLQTKGLPIDQFEYHSYFGSTSAAFGH